MQDFTLPKITGSVQPADEMSSLQQESLNIVEQVGQTPTPSDGSGENNIQLGIAVASYSSHGDYYSDSGVTNAYILSPIGNKKGIFTYPESDGARIRFRPQNTNNGASTVNVNGNGVKNIKLSDGITNPSSGHIRQNVLHEIVYNLSADVFVLLNPFPIFNTLYQGAGMAINISDPNNDIDFFAGVIADSTGIYLMTLPSTMTKRLDAAWAAGSGNGGLFSGSKAASTTYHGFWIRNTTTGAIDAGFDTSVTAANIPAGWVAYRRIFSNKTDGSSNWRQILNIGDDFILLTTVNDVDLTNQGTAAVTSTLGSIPSGIVMKANLIAQLNLGTDALSVATLITSLFQPDTAPIFPTGTPFSGLFTFYNTTSGALEGNVATLLNIYTNTSAQIRSRQNFASADTRLTMMTLGWTDNRGRLG